ncbi:hypothetical protein GQ53DRAFT_746973 [Thozetella sp. PMI_491]|nr:hypothetical protein GQ53DRAFT_746973 [Thozetella sp. PMI_491]
MQDIVSQQRREPSGAGQRAWRLQFRMLASPSEPSFFSPLPGHPPAPSPLPHCKLLFVLVVLSLSYFDSNDARREGANGYGTSREQQGTSLQIPQQRCKAGSSFRTGSLVISSQGY